jgi:hypothetical protein
MKIPRFLIIVAALVGATAAAIPAAASWLGVADELPATSYTYYPDIRDLNGRVNNMGLTTDPQVGELTVDDSTGVVLTTPTTAAALKAAPVALGKSRGGVALSVANGTITVNRSGLYQVWASCGKITGVNSQAVTLDVFEKVGSASAAATSPAIHAEITQPSTALATVSLASNGLVEVTDGDAAAGAIFDFRMSGSTGNVTCKSARLGLRKVGELAPPTTREVY